MLERPSPKTETSRFLLRKCNATRTWTSRVIARNDLVFQNDRLLFIQMIRTLTHLCLNIELSLPQAFNDKLVALCALVNVLNVVCGMLANMHRTLTALLIPVVVSKWLVAS